MKIKIDSKTELRLDKSKDHFTLWVYTNGKRGYWILDFLYESKSDSYHLVINTDLKNLKDLKRFVMFKKVKCGLFPFHNVFKIFNLNELKNKAEKE